ncbi:iron chelate uptake ABC transporter family permease subunit [Tardiphaga sp.]|uniref:iron chelate uptake ABC transporter family permease subunit n=1 Tax=Tardiphaga sp. TaxID=1926292 RepID=UPI0037DA633F
MALGQEWGWKAISGFIAIVPVAIYHAQRINLLEMGDDAARQLGGPVERTRLIMVMAAVSLTAIATAAAGPIAFIALAGPQLARRLTRSSGVPLVSGALMGAVLLLGDAYLLWLLTMSKKV